MQIGEKLRVLREEKAMSQGDVEKCTGLLRCYISRVENGHTVPSLETLERFASALQVPLYKLFYPGKDGASPRMAGRRKSLEEQADLPGKAGQDARYMLELKSILSRLREADRQVVLTLARKLASR